MGCKSLDPRPDLDHHYAPVEAIRAQMTGTVWRIQVRVGDRVTVGDVVAVLESMKMEMPVEAGDRGMIKEILVREGQPIAEGDLIAVVE